ncbi:FxsA family protein [Cobetia crustatorum]|uniref:FxsA family protein n=1 Tax=Cobetia crustatorum TaxID=553385 RepID=UPI000469A8AC|nr:FxsA family protein [Cobetia crustatorum]
MPILLVITLFGLLDFVVLFSLGSQIGLLPTLAMVLITGAVGLHLIKREGRATLMRAQERLQRGEMPSGELMEGAALIFGGALLMAPGFLSDALGLLCLLPASRSLLTRSLSGNSPLARFFKKRFKASRPSQQTHASSWGASASDSSGSTSHTEHDNQRTGDQQGQKHHSDGQPLEGDYISRDEPRL